MTQAHSAIAVTKRQAWLFHKIKGAPAWAAKAEAQRIALEHAEKHGISYEDITSRSRRMHIVTARHEAMAAVYLALPRWSLHAIGQFFGGSHHATVLYAVKKMGVWRGAAA